MEVKKFSSIREMMNIALEDAGDKTAYRFRDKNSEIRSVSFAEFFYDTRSLLSAFNKLGIADRHIMCAAANSYGWIVSFLAVLQGAGVFVPVDKELPPSDLIRLIDESDSEVIIFDSRLREFFYENAEKLCRIKYFIDIDGDSSKDRFISLSDCLKLGRENGADNIGESSDENDLKLLVFTSGTTGKAKGVMLTEHNIVSAVYYGLQVCQPLTTALSVLPYFHTYEAVCDVLISIHTHSCLCINDNVRHVMENLKLYKPDYIFLVPMFAEMFCSTVIRKLKKDGAFENFRKRAYLSAQLRALGADCRREIFSPILDFLGGELRYVVCGGAPIRKEIAQFFDAIGISLIGGYGITECSPLVSVNAIEDITLDTVGHRLPCLEWRIDNPAADGTGEILVRGDVVMKGYYKAPEKTAEVLSDDGWFSTGDYGRLTPDDKLIITGRKKNVIVLSNGKNVYPEEIENYILGIDYISEALVYAKKNQYGDEVALAAEVYCAGDCSVPELEADIKHALSQLPFYKQINEVTVRHEPFKKTATNKIIRV